MEITHLKNCQDSAVNNLLGDITRVMTMNLVTYKCNAVNDALEAQRMVQFNKDTTGAKYICKEDTEYDCNYHISWFWFSFL